jgi:hypothetical protein
VCKSHFVVNWHLFSNVCNLMFTAFNLCNYTSRNDLYMITSRTKHSFCDIEFNLFCDTGWTHWSDTLQNLNVFCDIEWTHWVDTWQNVNVTLWVGSSAHWEVPNNSILHAKNKCLVNIISLLIAWKCIPIMQGLLDMVLNCIEKLNMRNI